MERGQFTFYRSFWDALQTLPKKERLAAFEAICDYALNGNEQPLTGSAATIFILTRPTLDSGRKKAASGKHGGEKSKANAEESVSKAEANGKQSGSKTEANAKQTASKKEREKEKEKEIENECYARTREAFDVFWESYPKKVGKEAARKAFAKVKMPVETLVAAVEAQKRGEQWTRDGGQYIPNPTTWLNQGRWEDEVQTSVDRGLPKGKCYAPDKYLDW